MVLIINYTMSSCRSQLIILPESNGPAALYFHEIPVPEYGDLAVYYQITNITHRNEVGEFVADFHALGDAVFESNTNPEIRSYLNQIYRFSMKWSRECIPLYMRQYVHLMEENFRIPHFDFGADFGFVVVDEDVAKFDSEVADRKNKCHVSKTDV